MNIVIVGVGGQGTLLASRIIGKVATMEGYDVKVSEVHGMSQRGGSVITYVRYGKKVYSPIITDKNADIVLAFENLEALRALNFVRDGGKIIVNTQEMLPMPVITGAAEYPQNIIETISENHDITAIDALSLAKAAGTAKAANVVLIGNLAKHSEIAKEKWIEAIKETVPPKFLDVNINAFEKGYAI